MLELLNTWQRESQAKESKRIRARRDSVVKGHYRNMHGHVVWIEEHTRCAHTVRTTTIVK